MMVPLPFCMDDEYEEQLAYLRRIHPEKKLVVEELGDTPLDTILNKEDLAGLIKEYDLKCGGCGLPLLNRAWVAILHVPKTGTRIHLAFVCHDTRDKCVTLWGAKRQR